jgi:hypothetical protein
LSKPSTALLFALEDAGCPRRGDLMKAPEEGYVWEWRAFGRLRQTLIKKIKAQPIRIDDNGNSLSDILGQDLYLISPASEHNIKLRKSIGSEWTLKFKLLVRTEAHAIELYQESNKKFYRFPVTKAVVEETAELLSIKLPESFPASKKMDADSFVQILKNSMPAVKDILVGKIRSQYQFENGWVELADVTFPNHRTQSISLHSFERKGLDALFAELPIDDNLEVMNYLEACRRWV